MLVDEMDQRTQENRKGFTTAGRGIYKSAFTIDNLLPALFLEQKRVLPFCGQPLVNDFVTWC